MKYWKVPKQILFTVGKIFNKDNTLFTVVEELSRMNTFSKYINMVCVEEIRSYVPLVMWKTRRRYKSYNE